MTLDLEGQHLAFLVKLLFLVWPSKMMVGCWPPELAMGVSLSMMSVENHNLLVFFTLMVVQR
jgi:hypothetical protein